MSRAGKTENGGEKMVGRMREGKREGLLLKKKPFPDPSKKTSGFGEDLQTYDFMRKDVKREMRRGEKAF